jgi:putative addiction module component (TIGR02574 family)
MAMTQEATELLKKALTLPDEERAALAGSLIESLDTAVDESAEAAWNQEIERRIENLDSGRAKVVPWEDIRSWISDRLGHGR